VKAPELSESPPTAPLLQTLLEESFAFASPHGTITRWGAGAARLFGLPPEEMTGRSLFDSVLGSDDGGWRALLESEAGSASATIETQLHRSDGREFPCEVRFVPVALADGLEFSWFTSDLTADRPLEEKEERLRERHPRVVELLERGGADEAPRTVDGALAGIVVTFRSTAPGPVTPGERLEDAIVRTARTEREVVDLREPMVQIAADTDRLAARLEEMVEAIEDLGRRVEPLERASSAPGTLEELRAGVAEAAAVANEARHKAAEAQRDALTTRRALAALRPPAAGLYAADGDPAEPARPARAGFDDASMPMATLTLEGNFMELNPGFRELVGYSEEEFASARWPSNLDREHLDECERIRELLAAGELEGTRVHAPYMHREGMLVELSGRMSLVRDAQGSPDHLLLTLDVR
jgi:PAS domain S-box-containing protein